MDPTKAFQEEVIQNLNGLGKDADLHALSRIWAREVTPHKYAYNFTWLGRPIIQLPQDIVALQHVIWKTQPSLIIETGIAHGGSLILSASLLELNAICGGDQDARVIAVDIDIREHNRRAIESHPMSKRICMIQGSSVDESIVAQVQTAAAGERTVLVCLDSNHTHDHVLGELEAYASLVTKGSYCIVFDTLLDDMPESFFPQRSWGPGNSPKTAVREFLSRHAEFEVDREMDNRLLISVAPEGYLRKSH